MKALDMKAPNPKFQAPEKRQISISKGGARSSQLEVWKLDLLWSLELGIWNFAV
jgi:hypothetical protein